MTAYQFFSI